MSSESQSSSEESANEGQPISFKSLGLLEKLCLICEKIGWTSPTDIQKAAIPPALEGKDVIGLAETGSGKTGAFGLPILQAFLTGKTRNEPFAVILAPTRELVFQIKNQMDKLGKNMGINSVAIVGGVPRDHQIEQLSSRPPIIVATPGRLLDHLQKTKRFSVKTVQYLVLDEADRILSLDFEKELKEILEYIPEQRKTLLFSATMTTKVSNLVSQKTLRDPVHIKVSKEYQTATNLKEYMLLCPLLRKYIYLSYVMQKIGKDKSSIIFCSTKQETLVTAALLRNLGIWALPLHGSFTQEVRLNILNKFKARTHKALVATDIAARGLDLPSVDFVINFDLPLSSKVYIHRVGRTARAGKSGTSITFLTQYEVKTFLKIEEALKYKMDPYPAPEEEVMREELNVEAAKELAEKQAKKFEKQNSSSLYKKRKERKEGEFSQKLLEVRTKQKRQKMNK